MYYNLSRYKVEREHKGQKVIFAITESWAYDETSVEGSVAFDDPIAERNYLELFDTGELVNCLVKVTARALNCESDDCLGGCHIVADNAENNFREIIDEYGMVDSAIASCIREIDNQIETLTPFFVNLPK